MFNPLTLLVDMAKFYISLPVLAYNKITEPEYEKLERGLVLKYDDHDSNVVEEDNNYVTRMLEEAGIDIGGDYQYPDGMSRNEYVEHIDNVGMRLRETEGNCTEFEQEYQRLLELNPRLNNVIQGKEGKRADMVQGVAYGFSPTDLSFHNRGGVSQVSADYFHRLEELHVQLYDLTDQNFALIGSGWYPSPETMTRIEVQLENLERSEVEYPGVKQGFQRNDGARGYLAEREAIENQPDLVGGKV